MYSNHLGRQVNEDFTRKSSLGIIGWYRYGIENENDI
jgi:hypothetical protein